MTADKLPSRDILLGAALDAFADHGYKSASTRDIARAANMPMSQITYHFGGKEGLYLACARMIAEHMGALLNETLAGIEATLALSTDRQTARTCLDRLLSALVAAMLNSVSPSTPRFVFREQAEPTRAFAILYEGVMGRVLGTLETLIARVSGQSGEVSRVLAITTFGQVLVFRAARASVLAFTGWSDIGTPEIASIRQALSFNLDAICDRPEKGPYP